MSELVKEIIKRFRKNNERLLTLHVQPGTE